MEDEEFFLLDVDILGFVGEGIFDLGNVLDELLMAVVDTELCSGASGWKSE
jgi:hypothetical protein